MRSKFTWLAVAAAVTAVIGIGIVIERSWNAIGTSEISLAGWLAMGFGIVATLALGIGLMALMFFSSRHGYDEAGREDR